MSETCFYHPRARGSATCPGCQQLVCDRCRAAGDFTTCGACIQLGPGGGVTPELLAAASQSGGGGHGANSSHQAQGEADWGQQGGSYGADENFAPPTCTKHPAVLAEMQCMGCFLPFCLPCCPSGYCTECAPKMANRVQQQLDYQPSGGGNLDDIGASYEGLDHLALGYDEWVEPQVEAQPSPRKTRASGGKRAAKGKNASGKGAGSKASAKGHARKKASGIKWGPLLGGVLLLSLLGGGAYGAYLYLNQAPPQQIPVQAQIEFVKPAQGAKLSGVVVVQVKVGTPEKVKQVELTINGRYWNKWKAPLAGPLLSTEWPTMLPQFKKGSHQLDVKVEYQGGEKAQSMRKVVTR